MKRFLALAVIALLCAVGYTQGFKDGENLLIGTKGDLGIKRLGPAVAGITDGGTSQGAIPAVYSCGTTATCTQAISTVKFIQVYGTFTLAAATGIITALPFTATGNFACTSTDTNAAPAANGMVPASASTATITGTSGHAISYECHGF